MSQYHALYSTHNNNTRTTIPEFLLAGPVWLKKITTDSHILFTYKIFLLIELKIKNVYL